MSAPGPGITQEPGRGPSRRSALALGAAAAVAVGAVPVVAARQPAAEQPVNPAEPATFGAQQVAFYSEHQAGVDTLPQQAHAVFVALDLRSGSGRDDVVRLLRMLTDDAARLAQGRPPLGAEDDEIAALPARFTTTIGFGAGLFDAIGRSDQCPPVVRSLPPFRGERLEVRWSGGDLLLQVCSDDPVRLSYGLRRLVRDARSVADVRWVQRGFGPARGSEPFGTTPRNLFGQRDGTANPAAGTAELADAVWNRGQPTWLAGGSMLVLRRIRFDVDTWDDLGRFVKEQSVGRRLSSGAPLTGGGEHDWPDLQATDQQGFAVVDPNAHVALATQRAPAERMLRRGYSYDDGPDAHGRSDAGLLFAAYQADAATAFVPVQRRLAESDALNRWTTHVGSAAFAIPPGCAPGEFVGQPLVGG